MGTSLCHGSLEAQPETEIQVGMIHLGEGSAGKPRFWKNI